MIKIVLFILAVTVFLQLLVTGVLAGRGDELAKLEREAERMQRENSVLRQGLAEKSSLAEISSAAEKLGFAKPEAFVYINLSESVALEPANASSLP